MPVFRATRSRGVVVLAAAAVLAVGAGSGAVAGSLITGKDIKNRSIEARDLARDSVTTQKVKNGTIKLKDLNPEVTGQLGEAGAQGPQGPKGDQGPQGPKGADGTAAYAGPHWSIIDRNLIGAADAFLRSGPTTNWADTMVEPPMGVGSLGLRTASGSDKAAFGNEVDFQGMALADVSDVSWWEYTTEENKAKNVANLASIAMEIDPNANGRAYGTLNYNPQEIPGNTWSKITADQKRWWLTGAAGTDINCTQSNYCTLAEVKAALPDATLYTVAFSKGRDHAFSGAVDALTIGSTTYDFEPFGVTATQS